MIFLLILWRYIEICWVIGVILFIYELAIKGTDIKDLIKPKHPEW